MREPTAVNAYLLLRSASRLCALPLSCIVEIMRPLPIRPVQGAPVFVTGLAVIRGRAIPVVDLRVLLGSLGPTRPERFVALRVGPRRLALAVDHVLGVRSLPAGAFHALPPLFGGPEAPVIASVGALDSDLLVLLQASRLLPEEVPA
ncbi:MAG TPA: chemotaxis protein CheW [Planctomycetota bacterium]|nr:chemotaxis protein CheW [Planctomycetota bacterium]